MLPDARRSSGRNGCGAVTIGLVGSGFTGLIFVNGGPLSEVGIGDNGGICAAAAFKS